MPPEDEVIEEEYEIDFDEVDGGVGSSSSGIETTTNPFASTSAKSYNEFAADGDQDIHPDEDVDSYHQIKNSSSMTKANAFSSGRSFMETSLEDDYEASDDQHGFRQQNHAARMEKQRDFLNDFHHDNHEDDSNSFEFGGTSGDFGSVAQDERRRDNGEVDFSLDNSTDERSFDHQNDYVESPQF